jgi:hypothetical protein
MLAAHHLMGRMHDNPQGQPAYASEYPVDLELWRFDDRSGIRTDGMSESLAAGVYALHDRNTAIARGNLSYDSRTGETPYIEQDDMIHNGMLNPLWRLQLFHTGDVDVLSDHTGDVAVFSDHTGDVAVYSDYIGYLHVIGRADMLTGTAAAVEEITRVQHSSLSLEFITRVHHWRLS